MSEPNPYEPPRELEPLTTAQVVKRSAGIGVILLLTPIAAGIAGFISCIATDMAPHGGNPVVGFATRSAISMIPLLLALGGMSWWAIYLHQCTQPSAGRWNRFATIMTLTPIVVIAAMGASVMATGYVVDAFKDLGAAITAGIVTFFAPPTITLIGMLIAAWYVLPRQAVSGAKHPDRNELAD